jgi:excisionase family DNA binding protein
MDKEVLTVKQVAEFLQMDERTIYKLAKQGDIPSFKVSNQWRFLKKDIEIWVEQKKSEVMRKTEKTLKEKD